ncbi:MAG TPA: hypothetical protein VHQ65_12940, partial [Thermoanaerobaculia bacterium]|nr:hypothetical protein [Thermoanaerobaculia bacterium]
RRGIAAALAGGALLVWVPAVWLMAAALRNGRLAAVATGAVAALVAPLLLRPAGLLPRGRRGYVAAGLVAAVGTIAAILAVRLG